MNEPRVITRTETVTWKPVTGPLPCQCGHMHYGRVRHGSQAPQWHLCEQEDCLCTALRIRDPS